MIQDLRAKVLASFQLTDEQKSAAEERIKDVVVTAGAGSGKTSTLVARYASLLADGVDLRRIIAVTFTEKAAREMRSRARKILGELVEKAVNEEERNFWGELNSKMDAARIGTIHSLCAEMLRAHPVEAAVDPRFDISDESLTAALHIQIVDDTLSRLVGIPEFAPLFQIFEIRNLKELLLYMLEKRLEVQETFASEFDIRKSIQTGFASLLQDSLIIRPLNLLREFSSYELVQDAGEALAAQVVDMLEMWELAESELAAGELYECAHVLHRIRREKMNLQVGKRNSEVKEFLKSLKSGYDELLQAICGGSKESDPPPSEADEAIFQATLELLKAVFRLMITSYKEALQQTGSLDFADLEDGAARLLKNPAVRETWQGQVDALLVDEFQDTNQRQRDIVIALTGSPGKLFIVGDAKQSIYRFRQADVTVFRAIRQSIRRQGGLPVNLSKTFRTHASLLNGMNNILRAVMGDQEDPGRPYYEPFNALIPHWEEPQSKTIQEPYIEFVLGSGDDATTGRVSAAHALAARLSEMKAQGQITSWNQVVLLFRAGRAFPHYENAFEEAGIPFVTVAGQGFFDRSEIRDLLNIMHSLADPANDLAMAGLMRSPAFGLTDAALYQLRWRDGKAVNYWAALQNDLSMLSENDRLQAERLVGILKALIPQVDRVPVSELLRKLVNLTDYRTILAIQDQTGGNGRLWRNLDKLIEDAHASGKVNVRDFLDYIKTMNESGAREGEAPAEAHNSVRLMTIHRAKGLEFPIVVLADASRIPRKRGEIAYNQQDLGFAFKMDPEPILYQMAKLQEKRQGEAEEQRILYVALTRAEDKLIINGHITHSDKKGWSASAWLADLTLAANVDVNEVIDNSGKEVISYTSSGQPVRAWAPVPQTELIQVQASKQEEPPQETDLAPLYKPLIIPVTQDVEEDDTQESRSWRVTGMAETVPPGIIGKMVHKAVEHWLFPPDPTLRS